MYKRQAEVEGGDLDAAADLDAELQGAGFEDSFECLLGQHDERQTVQFEQSGEVAAGAGGAPGEACCLGFTRGVDGRTEPAHREHLVGAAADHLGLDGAGLGGEAFEHGGADALEG